MCPRIISLVLSWDASEFRKQASQIESSKDTKDRPTKEQLAALKAYLNMPAPAHQALREVSATQQKSIVVAILDNTDPRLTASLTGDAQHAQCLAWLSAQLSARDRDEITRVLCRSQPDFLTAAVRGAVDTYDPFIRAIHEGMDLREHISAVETFLNDLVATSKPKTEKPKGGGAGVNSSMFSKKNGKPKTPNDTTTTTTTRPPSVDDFVALLNRNKGLLFTYLHQVAKNCVDLREHFRKWTHGVLAEFRTPQQQGHESSSSREAGAGAMGAALQEMYASLPSETLPAVLASLDAHARYLAELDSLSEGRMQRVLDQLSDSSSEGTKTPADSSGTSSPTSPTNCSISSTSSAGPGVYLMRWTSLLDATRITPAAPSGGPVRCGRDVRGQKAWGKTTVAGELDVRAEDSDDDGKGDRVPEAPDVTAVMEALRGRFREVVNHIIGEVRPPTLKDSAIDGRDEMKARVALTERDAVEGSGDDLAVGVNGIALAG